MNVVLVSMAAAVMLAGPAEEKDVKALQEGCDKGVAGDCGTLGWMYRSGNDSRQRPVVEKDAARALALFNKGCDGNDATSCDALAYLHDTGDGLPKDTSKAEALWDKALALHEKACAAGNAAGCAGASTIVNNRAARRGFRELERITGYHLRGCELGDTSACHFAATDLQLGRGVPVDLGRAKELEARGQAGYEKKCDDGDPAFCGYAAWVYQRGGAAVPQDDQKALALLEKGCALEKKEGRSSDALACDNLKSHQEWLAQKAAPPAVATADVEKACAAGEAKSCTELVRRLESGLWSARDLPRAEKLLADACARDGARCTELGYFNARAGNYAAAVAAFDKSCASGSEHACGWIVSAFRDGMYGMKKDAERVAAAQATLDRKREEKRTVLQEGCDKGSAEDCHKLAEGLDPRWKQGQGDGTRMLALLEKACDMKYARSCRWLAGFYAEAMLPNIEQRDPAKGKAYMQKACGAGDKEACGKDKP